MGKRSDAGSGGKEDVSDSARRMRRRDTLTDSCVSLRSIVSGAVVVVEVLPLVLLSMVQDGGWCGVRREERDGEQS